MAEARTGGCLCGAVRYEVRGELRPVVACHCLQCRKTSGHYVAATQVERESMTVTGDGLRWFRSSAEAERGFCSACGSNLFWRRIDHPLVSIFAGTIDGATGLRMASQIHCASAGDYYDLPDVPEVRQDELD